MSQLKRKSTGLIMPFGDIGGLMGAVNSLFFNYILPNSV